MARIIGSPLRYIQGVDEIKNIAKDIKDFGTKFLFIVDKPVLNRVQGEIEKSFSRVKKQIKFEIFSGECSMKEIERLERVAKRFQADCVVSVGGGKGADATKVVGFRIKSSVIVFSTAASCDAPCSHSAIIYKENGEFDQYYYPSKSPDMVIVDTKIIAEAPVRLLVAGLGDALSTYFEARSAYASNRDVNEWKGRPSLTGMALADLCYKTILADGYKAKVAVENKVSTIALENVVEANTYLSTIGFESGGLGAAHSVQDALSLIPEVHHSYHGEKVAFGTLVHLVLENAPMSEINTVLKFCVSVGLPVCLADLNIVNINKKLLMKVAEKATGPGVPMGNMPFKVTAYDVYSAILVADQLGKTYKENGCLPNNSSCGCKCGCGCNK